MAFGVSGADYYNLLSSSGLNSALNATAAQNADSSKKATSEEQEKSTIPAVSSKGSASSAASVKDEYISSMLEDFSSQAANNRSRNGTSTLFDSFSNLNSMFSDRSLIQSGVYKKMAAAYFDQADGTSASAATKEATSLSTLSGSASDLKSAALSLMNNSLYQETTTSSKDAAGNVVTSSGYDRSAILSAAKSFVSAYNDTLDGMDNVSSVSVLRKGVTMTGMTDKVSEQLAKAGITVNKDNSLSLDETKFNAAGMSTLKALFAGSTSYAASTAQRASMIATSASNSAGVGNSYRLDTEA
jgi:hypothetical protein